MARTQYVSPWPPPRLSRPRWHRATASVQSPLACWSLFWICQGTGPANDLAADPVSGSAAFGDLGQPFLGWFPFWMRTHCAIATGVNASLVDVLLAVIDERQL